MRSLWLVCAALVLLARPGAAAEASVETAYKREFAFLEAEKTSLKQRILALEGDAQKKTAAAQAEVDALQGRLMGASLEADRQIELLQQTEMQAESAGEGTDVLDGVLQQAVTALDKAGVKFPEAKAGDGRAQAEQVAFAFEKAVEILGTLGTVRQHAGTFFGHDGRQLDGQLLHVGNIATYGVAGDIAGALAPAGENQLKLWPGLPSADSARMLLAGQRPESLRLFLYESLDKSVEPKLEKTPLEIIQSGGIIAWVIVALGAVALLMIVLRALFLGSAAANTDKLVDRITPLLERGEVEKAIAVCQGARSAAGRVLKATLRHLDSPKDHLDDVISESILHEQPFLDRFGSTILVLAAVAPLLGLLGTVTGMISTFDVITEYGTGNPKLLSGGISEALVTTELGLIVAIPTLLLGNMLAGWAESIKDAIDKAALRLTNVAAGIRVAQSVTPRQPAAVLAPAS
jgi:biopolymer transport protein ExbB